MEDKFDEYFKFEKSALRLEVLPYYRCGETQSVKDYMNGLPFNVNQYKEWNDFLESCKKQNKIVKKIRVLPDKINDYNLFELRTFENNHLHGGEECYVSVKIYNEILNKYKIKSCQEYWLLDDKDVLLMFYDDDNDYKYCKKTKENLELYCNIIHDLEKKSTPLEEVLKKTRENIKIIV